MNSDKPLPPESIVVDRSATRKAAVSLVLISNKARADVAAMYDISVSTLDKWIARAKTGGDDALKDRQRERIPIEYGSVKPLVESLAAKSKFRNMNVTVAALAIHQELHDTKYGLDKVPSVSTIYNWIRRTEKAVRSNSTPYERATAAGQVFQVDSTTLAYDVYDDDGRSLGRGTVTVVVDAYTRYLVGWAFALRGESVAQVAEALTHACFEKKDDPDCCSFSSVHVLVDNGSAHRSKSFRDALIERAATYFRLKYRAIGHPESGGVVERTLQTIEKRMADHGGKASLAAVKKILSEVCKTYNHTFHSALGTTPTAALAVSKTGSKNRPGVGSKIKPLPDEHREKFLLDLLNVARSPQVRACRIVYENLTYYHPELDDLHKTKVALKTSPENWRHFVYIYHPKKEVYLKAYLDSNANQPFTELEVETAVGVAKIRGQQVSNETVLNILSESSRTPAKTKRDRRDQATKSLNAEKLDAEKPVEATPRPKISFPKDFEPLDTELKQKKPEYE